MVFHFSLLVYLLSSFFGMLCVAFFTLVERKVLGVSQERFGPGKVSLFGFFQPFVDVFKLFSKGVCFSVSFFFFVVFPVLNVFLMLVFFGGVGFWLVSFNFFFFCIFVVSLSSLGGFSILFAGWVSSSVYGVLGSLRALVQFVSYEISSSFLFFSFFFFFGCFFLFEFFWFGFFYFFFFFLLFLFFIIGVSAETQRAPFDFSEGESELVSGFNVEYSSVLFSVIFLTEYGMLLFFSWFTSLVFFGGFFLSVLGCVFLSTSLVVFRGSFPRFRFDLLQFFAWGVMLPFSMVFFFSFFFCF